MSAVFLKALNMSITASWMILAILLTRLILKKAPKWIPCLLWGLVAIRLIFPFSFESVLSLIPSSETIPVNIAEQHKPAIASGITVVNELVNPLITASFTPVPADSANPLQIVISAAATVWIAGIVIMLAYASIRYLKLKKTVSVCLPAGDRILACDEVKAPFILGVIRPVIYVPSSMHGITLEHVLRHERAHLQRHDHWWKPLGFLLLSVYWFNPLCWIAYVLLCRDIEMACDEKVIRDMDKNETAAYLQALLDCSLPQKRIAACPLAFGELSVKERVKGILNYKRPALWIVLTAALSCVILTVCFMTNPTSAKESAASPPPELEETAKPSHEHETSATDEAETLAGAIMESHVPDYFPPFSSPDIAVLYQQDPYSELLPQMLLEGMSIESVYLAHNNAGNAPDKRSYLGIICVNNDRSVTEFMNDTCEIKITGIEDSMQLSDLQNPDSYTLSNYYQSQKKNKQKTGNSSYGLTGVFSAQDLTEDTVNARRCIFPEGFSKVEIDIVCGEYLVSYSYTGAPVAAGEFLKMIRSAKFFSGL